MQKVRECGACIITYNPSEEKLKLCLEAVAGQVGKVYCFDNGSADISGIRELIGESGQDNVELICSEKNIGIPAAVNRVMEKSRSEGMRWLLTLDQDSVVGEGLAEKLVRVLLENEDAALSCPWIFDGRRYSLAKRPEDEGIGEVEFCITSGCMMDIGKVLEAGGLDEWLFIDFVDNELCHRVRLNGYRILQDRGTVLEHELGKVSPARFAAFYRKLAQVTHIGYFGRLTYHREVAPVRMYYATRNCLYLRKKYRRHPNRAFSLRWTIYNGLAGIVRGREKRRIAGAFFRGFRDGLKAGCDAYEPGGRV